MVETKSDYTRAQMPLTKENVKAMFDEVADAGNTCILEGAPGIGKTDITESVIRDGGRPHVFTSAYVIYEDDTRPVITPNTNTGEQNVDLSDLIKRILRLQIESSVWHKKNPDQASKRGIYWLDELNLLNGSDMKAILHWFNAQEIDLPEDLNLKEILDKTEKRLDQLYKNDSESATFIKEAKESMLQNFLETGTIKINDIALASAWNDPNKGFLAANFVDPSMSSRLALFPAVVDIDSFAEHAFLNFDSDVAGFIQTNRNSISGQDNFNSKKDDSKISPRMLERLSRTLIKAKSPNGSYTQALLTHNGSILKQNIDSLVKNGTLTATFLNSLTDKNRVSLDELMKMDPKAIQKTFGQQKPSDQMRLWVDILHSTKYVVGNTTKKDQVSVRDQFLAMLHGSDSEIQQAVSKIIKSGTTVSADGKRASTSLPNFDAIVKDDKDHAHIFNELNRLTGIASSIQKASVGY